MSLALVRVGLEVVLIGVRGRGGNACGTCESWAWLAHALLRLRSSFSADCACAPYVCSHYGTAVLVMFVAGRLVFDLAAGRLVLGSAMLGGAA